MENSPASTFDATRQSDDRWNAIELASSRDFFVPLSLSHTFSRSQSKDGRNAREMSYGRENTESRLLLKRFIERTVCNERAAPWLIFNIFRVIFYSPGKKGEYIRVLKYYACARVYNAREKERREFFTRNFYTVCTHSKFRRVTLFFTSVTPIFYSSIFPTDRPKSVLGFLEALYRNANLRAYSKSPALSKLCIEYISCVWNNIYI